CRQTPNTQPGRRLVGQPIEKVLDDDAGDEREQVLAHGNQEAAQRVESRPEADELPHQAPDALRAFLWLLHEALLARPTGPSATGTLPSAGCSLNNRAKWLSGSASNCSLGPCSTIRPSSSTMISSARRTVVSRWAMMIAVRLRSKRSTARSIFASVAGSRREDASSRITRPGSARKARVRASNWASPADSPSLATAVASPAGSVSY